MTIKNQLKTLKENWLLVLLVVVIVGVISFGDGATLMSGGGFAESIRSYGAPMAAMDEMAMVKSAGYMPSYSQDFAPEVEERVKTKSASLSTEVKRNTFYENEAKLKNILTASDAFLLDENVYKQGPEGFKYLVGSYQIKVETEKYYSVMSQLKEIGEIVSLSENTDDITGQYTDTQARLDAEKERLRRYNEMYNETKDVEEKLRLTDRIFNQERTIKYLEDSMRNMGNRVSYSSIYFSLQEKRSDWSNILFVKFSELVRSLVNSVNSVLKLVFWAVPWAIAIGLVWLVMRLVRRKRN